MVETLTLVMTDIVDSTQVNERIGDGRMRALWERHDALARELIHTWRGIEVGRSDGFLVLFQAPADALEFALAYHRVVAGLDTPLQARVGVHLGPVSLRRNRSEDTARGATPYDVDGVALPIAARVMGSALGGQTLTTEATLRLPLRRGLRVESHGHWRLKGLESPIELFEVGDHDAPFVAPPDSAKAYRVVFRDDVWTTLRAVPNNLPAERGAFVGRLDALKALGLRFDEGARLVTLVGIGGVGKTRLVLSFARSWLGDYPGGVWFCDLNAARSIDGIVHAVTQSLEIPAGPGDPVARIGAAIAGRGACLVVLDTFEQVARHAEKTLGAWLERAPEARFLVTSREVLGIGGENAMVLAPLAPDEAQRLFRQRVRAAGVTAALPATDERAVPALMALLDRLPLAIELAAARARVMSPAVMLQRMGDRFKLLAGRGARHDRQNTLRATLDWSWELLGPLEQAALMQLAVFEGGISLEAAEAVVGPGLPSDDEWVPDLLQALIEKSLLHQCGAQRYELLRAVQDYADERLRAAGALSATEERHWRWFAGLTEAQAVARRGEESENIVLACRRAAAGGAPAVVAVDLLRNAWAVLRLTGPFGVATALSEAVGAALSHDDPSRALVDHVRGSAARLLGDLPTARACYASAMAIANAAADGRMLARTQCQLAQMELASGDAQAAERVLLEARRGAAGSGEDPELECDCLNGLGLSAMQQSRWGAAQKFFSEALAWAERCGDAHWQGGLHGNLGMVARAQGRREEARRHWEAALGFSEEVGDRQWAGNHHSNLGLLLLELGELEAATAHLRFAVETAQAIGHSRLQATALCNLGLVEAARGDHFAAHVYQSQAVNVAHALGDRRLEGQARGYLGLELSELGHHEAALSELREAEAQLQPLRDPAALALALLQLVVACTAASDHDAAEDAMNRAGSCLEQMAEGVESEVALMVERARTQLNAMTLSGAARCR